MKDTILAVAAYGSSGIVSYGAAEHFGAVALIAVVPMAAFVGFGLSSAQRWF